MSAPFQRAPGDDPGLTRPYGPAGELPAWIAERIHKPSPPSEPRTPPATRSDAGSDPYWLAALNGECAKVAAAPEGTRNDTLNRAAFTVAGIVHSGHLPPEPAMSELLDAGRRCGLPDPEIHKTIASAFSGAESKQLHRVHPQHDTVTAAFTVADPEPPVQRSPKEQTAALQRCHRTFRKWLGAKYDLDALHVVLAAAAAQNLDGDPLWVLLVSGSGNAKTETVQSLSGLTNTHVISTISSPGALLSATSRRDRSKTANGGLLRMIGPTGVLVTKDMTSILSMGRELRAEVLAALREIYDGKWVRTVGTDGGQTLEWNGRLTTIGAVTTAWDHAHTVIASMGDRFVLLRVDSTQNRADAGRQAISNTGSETLMRAELSAAVADVLTGTTHAAAELTLTGAEVDKLIDAADLVTLARTGVEFDYQGNVSESHAPEAPTRFAKQLTQVVRGGIAAGLTRNEAMCLAIRCARDSMPPLRLSIIDWLATNPHASTTEIRRGVGKPRATVDRQLQALHMLGALECREEEVTENRLRWYYTLRSGVDPSTLSVPEMSVDSDPPGNEFQKCQ